MNEKQIRLLLKLHGFHKNADYWELERTTFTCSYITEVGELFWTSNSVYNIYIYKISWNKNKERNVKFLGAFCFDKYNEETFIKELRKHIKALDP